MVMPFSPSERMCISIPAGKPAVTVTVLVLNEYDLTAEKVRKALDVYGDCDAIVTSNPNASMSSSAKEAGEASGKRVLLFPDLLSDLNRPWN